MVIFTDMSLMSQAEIKSLCDSRASKSAQPIQDTITGSFLLTQANTVVDPITFMQCASSIGLFIRCNNDVEEGVWMY